MDNKKILLIVLFVILLAVAGVFGYKYRNSILQNEQKTNSTIIVEDKTITDSTKPFTIKIVYPQINGLDDFNQKAKAIIDKEVSDFKTNSLANDVAVKQIDPKGYAAEPREYELDIGYDKGEIDNNIVSTVFNIYNFEGGAHGASYFVPLNYDVKNKKEIALADLFPNQNDYLQKISAFCTKDLTTQLTKALGSLDGTTLQDGAGPATDNFQFFLINKNNIVFYFPQYQVAYGAAGNFKVTMPR